MATKLSFKKLKELHQKLGGNGNGFFITTFGGDYITGKNIRVEERIAYSQKSNANWIYELVSGKVNDLRDRK